MDFKEKGCDPDPLITPEYLISVWMITFTACKGDVLPAQSCQVFSGEACSCSSKKSHRQSDSSIASRFQLI
ncbi:hypothetical protein LguiA_033348 [Lonicera macranthoides]